MSGRELRFWPLLLGVYAVVWGLEALLARLRGLPIKVSFDLTVTDLAIFGIVVGVWLLAIALRNQETVNVARELAANEEQIDSAIAIGKPVREGAAGKMDPFALTSRYHALEISRLLSM
jgi:hypothetical protein